MSSLVSSTEKQQQQQHDSEKDVKQESVLRYAAIASMMNETSMNLRNIHPKNATPGIHTYIHNIAYIAYIHNK